MKHFAPTAVLLFTCAAAGSAGAETRAESVPTFTKDVGRFSSTTVGLWFQKGSVTHDVITERVGQTHIVETSKLMGTGGLFD